MLDGIPQLLAHRHAPLPGGGERGIWPPVEGEEKTPIVLVVLAWVVVAIPLAWGVAQTIAKSAPLFRR